MKYCKWCWRWEWPGIVVVLMYQIYDTIFFRMLARFEIKQQNYNMVHSNPLSYRTTWIYRWIRVHATRFIYRHYAFYFNGAKQQMVHTATNPTSIQLIHYCYTWACVHMHTHVYLWSWGPEPPHAAVNSLQYVRNKDLQDTETHQQPHQVCNGAWNDVQVYPTSHELSHERDTGKSVEINT